MGEKEDGEFRTWLKLWRGFPGALARAWGLLGIMFVVVVVLLR